jgi:ribonuclease HI
MRVTIITDASHDPVSKACGWAWWLASDRGKVGGRGHEITPVFNSSVAETLAIFRSLSAACKQGLVQTGDEILIQTDCDGSICAIRGMRTFIRDDEMAFANGVNDLAKMLNLALTMRHVKGHTAGKTPRTWINNKCDEFARIEMQKAKQLLKRLGTTPLADEIRASATSAMVFS